MEILPPPVQSSGERIVVIYNNKSPGSEKPEHPKRINYIKIIIIIIIIIVLISAILILLIKIFASKKIIKKN